MGKILIRFFLALLPATAVAQFSYTLDQSVPVTINDKSLSMPFAGGLNSAQVNTIDFDGDGKEDLVVYDRGAAKIMPFRNAGSKYEYAPDYIQLFPAEVNAWMLLRDFNCDGKKDLFTSDPFGMIAFVNTTKAGQPLSWRRFNPGFPLLTVGFSGQINLKINDVDIPSIDDVDNDGDLDILAMRFVGIGTVEWHKNMSIEKTGKCDSLMLERVTQQYGGMQECLCGNFSFNNSPCDFGGMRTEHVGGKALLFIDVDNDGDRDLLYAEETCTSLYLLKDNGTKGNPLFTDKSNFPPSKSAAFQFFPAPFYEDVDFDGLKDLVVSPNLYARTTDNTIVRNSLWFYKNTGSAQLPNFTYVKPNILQEEMIDVGDYSTPALFDADNDGDLDLFIGNYADESFRGTIYYFENTGTNTTPSFKLVNTDVGGLSQLSIFNIKPQFVDADNDGTTDLAFTATFLKDASTTPFFYAPNQSTTGLSLNFGAIVQTKLEVDLSETVHITDVDRDGKPDVLIGKSTGALQYWQNNNNSGKFDQLTLKNGSYLGLGISTSRQNPTVATGDLDADGFEDLVVGDQKGRLYFYGDYRNFDNTRSQPSTTPVFNNLTKEYVDFNFGGKTTPAIANIFNTSKPAIIVGNNLGGLYILRNDGGVDLPEEPVVGIGPIPLTRGNDLKIRSDRNAKVQLVTVLGQKLSEQIFVPANQEFPLSLNLAAGMYIARFTFQQGKVVSLKFIVE